jgi:hypothetical protein
VFGIKQQTANFSVNGTNRVVSKMYCEVGNESLKTGIIQTNYKVRKPRYRM